MTWDPVVGVVLGSGDQAVSRRARSGVGQPWGQLCCGADELFAIAVSETAWTPASCAEVALSDSPGLPDRELAVVSGTWAWICVRLMSAAPPMIHRM